MDILGQFGAIKMAEGEPIYEEYQTLGRVINSTIRTQERALLRQIQEEYDINAPVVNIQRQIRGDLPDCKEAVLAEEAMIKIPERRRIAEAAASDPSRFTGQKSLGRHIRCSRNMIALCKERENRTTKTNLPALPSMEPLESLPKKKLERDRRQFSEMPRISASSARQAIFLRRTDSNASEVNSLFSGTPTGAGSTSSWRATGFPALTTWDVLELS
jgi:hypothetical protein